MFKKRLMLSAIAYPMVNAVLFGLGAIVVLSFFTAQADVWLPAVIVASFVLAVPLAWMIAPQMSLRLSGKAYPHRADPAAR